MTDSNSTEFDYCYDLVKSALYAPDHYATVILMACALSYKLDEVDSKPHILALGLKGSGKSTILKIAFRLANKPEAPTGVKAMTAPSFVAGFRVNPGGTQLLDEINHLFGEAGGNGKNSQFYTYINQSYSRETAYAQYQENRVKLKIPIFGMIFMAGLGLGCPEDTRDRSIILRMEKAPDGYEVADFSMKETKVAFSYGGRVLKSWATRASKLDLSKVRGLHPKLNHRVMEIWGPLFAVALEVDGGEPGVWTNRMLKAFERIELNGGVPVYAPEDQLLVDYLEFLKDNKGDGIPSGAFAQYATTLPHGAYVGMKPGQFKQFAVKILGPTTPYYDAEKSVTVRGWSDIVHKLNIEHAHVRIAELEAAKDDDKGEAYEWEDF